MDNFGALYFSIDQGNNSICPLYPAIYLTGISAEWQRIQCLRECGKCIISEEWHTAHLYCSCASLAGDTSQLKSKRVASLKRACRMPLIFQQFFTFGFTISVSISATCKVYKQLWSPWSRVVPFCWTFITENRITSRGFTKKTGELNVPLYMSIFFLNYIKIWLPFWCRLCVEYMCCVCINEPVPLVQQSPDTLYPKHLLI